MLELVILLLTTYLLRIVTYGNGEQIKDAEHFYIYNYSSFYTIFVTILYLVTVTNFPELIIGAATQKNRFAIYTIVCVHAFLEIFVIYSIILGTYNDVYTQVIE